MTDAEDYSKLPDGAGFARRDVLQGALERQRFYCLCSQPLELGLATLTTLEYDGMLRPAAVHHECADAGELMGTADGFTDWAVRQYPDPEDRERMVRTWRRVCDLPIKPAKPTPTPGGGGPGPAGPGRRMK